MVALGFQHQVEARGVLAEAVLVELLYQKGVQVQAVKEMLVAVLLLVHPVMVQIVPEQEGAGVQEQMD